jgi:hypothetical protein
MAGVIATIPKHQFFDNSGNPAVGYKLYTYQANSLTPVLWHFAIICLKNPDERPIHQSPATIPLEKSGLNPTVPDSDAL